MGKVSAEVILAIVAAAVAVIAIVLLVVERIRTRRMLDRLSQMLNSAVNDEFVPSSYDESMLSSIENNLCKYLDKSSISSRKIAKEKENLTSLIADISHQTKTPIANIILYSELLAEEDLSNKAREYAACLGSQANRLQNLIDSLIKMSRLETGIIKLAPTKQKIMPLILEVERELKASAASKNLTLEVVSPNEARADVEAETLDASFDYRWTCEALHNIVENAVKYTPSSGTISINVSEYPTFARIDVHNTGTFIPEEERGRIFDRFYRSKTYATSSKYEGVGIGLFLVRKILESEDGYVKVASCEETGTTFSLFLLR